MVWFFEQQPHIQTSINIEQSVDTSRDKYFETLFEKVKVAPVLLKPEYLVAVSTCGLHIVLLVINEQNLVCTYRLSTSRMQTPPNTRNMGSLACFVLKVRHAISGGLLSKGRRGVVGAEPANENVSFQANIFGKSMLEHGSHDLFLWRQGGDSNGDAGFEQTWDEHAEYRADVESKHFGRGSPVATCVSVQQGQVQVDDEELDPMGTAVNQRRNINVLTLGKGYLVSCGSLEDACNRETRLEAIFKVKRVGE